jgi:tRNA(Ile)-lysidine synthase
VALAHHRDDQVETVLDRLMRGAGSGGLSGMAVRRNRIVRPLLEEPRSLIEAWANLRGLRRFEDPSNRKGTRGRIRHELLPLMRELREGASKSILRSAQHLLEDDQLLRAQAEVLLTQDGLALHDWEAAPAPIRRRAVLALVRAARGEATDLGAAQLDQTESLSQPGSWVALSDGWRLVRDSSHMRCLPRSPTAHSLMEGAWGIWQIQASETVLVRPIEPGEEGEGTALRERLRAAGVGAGLRPFHPVIVLRGRRWLPGVWLEREEEPPRATVQCERPPRPSIPPGGPYSTAL